MPWEPLRKGRATTPTRLNGSLDRIVQSLGAPSGDALTTIFQQWSEVVGPGIAAHTKPVRFRDGCLTIVVDDPAWSTQLKLLEAELSTKLNTAIGAEVVETLRTRVGSL